MKLLLLAPLVFVAACSSTQKKADTPALPKTISEAINSSYRTPANKERDKYRHPQETLEFFGLKPNMSVVEIGPSGGWYTEILVPFLATEGKYVASAVPSSVYAGGRKFLNWVNTYPEFKDKVIMTDFAPPAPVAEPNSADLVLTFRNVHNWMDQGQTEKTAFKEFFKALKSGGTLGVVEHRASPKSKFDPKAKSGYVSEKYIIRIAEEAGFKLAAKSEINANPKDKKNYPKGVWTLPPTFTEGDKDRAKYAEIGESDRMTLKFVKP